MRSIIAVLAISGILFSPSAFSTVCPATLGALIPGGSCTDDDGDIQFTLVSNTLPSNVAFSVTEIFATTELYNVAFDFPTGVAYRGGGSISYTLQALSGGPEPQHLFTGGNFDTDVQGTGALATKVVTSGGVTIGSLTSTNGSRDPAQGETPFAGGATPTLLAVTDTFGLAPGATYLRGDNSFSVTSRTTPSVPEPATVGLLGLGLALAGLRRPRVDRRPT